MNYPSKTLGMTVNVETPDSVEDLDSMVGEKDATLKAATRYYIYHTWNPKFRAAFSDAVQAETGVERLQASKGGELQFRAPKEGEEQGEPIMESEQHHINRALAEGIDEADLQRIATEVASGIPFTVASGGRTKKPLQKHIDAANTILAGIDSGAKTMEDFIDKFESLNSVQFSSLGDWSVETVALAVRVNEDRKLKNVVGDFA
tara:strand:- start:148 stop:759 length:612 start_codon:yes stop_codon:yes gene_type:complete